LYCVPITFTPYGYKKHPNDITKLIVDEEAAEVVKYIFNEYINGNGLAYIAHRLNEKKSPLCCIKSPVYTLFVNIDFIVLCPHKLLMAWTIFSSCK